MPLADGLIEDMAKHPEMKAALEQLNRTRKQFDAKNVSARLNLECELEGERVPVTIAITVGAEDEDEDGGAEF
jgi:hypothetical protein